MFSHRHLSAPALAALVLSIIASNSAVARFERTKNFLSSVKKVKIPSVQDIKNIRMPRLSAFFGSYVSQEEFERDYALPNLCSLTVTNIEGNITVQTGAPTDSIILSANKKTVEADVLPNMTVQESSIRKNSRSHFTLASVYVGQKTKGAIDYTLRVPGKIALQLRTGNGTISVKGVDGKLIAQTDQGGIEIQETTGAVLAQTEQKGDITIEQVNGDIKAVANQGTITIRNATKSIIASAQRGNIDAGVDKLDRDTLLDLNAASGNVMLALPSTASARVQAHTNSGLLTSSHWIKLTPMTTQLNKQAWRDFRRSVEGTINNGEAEVKLSSSSGNIKILDTTTT